MDFNSKIPEKSGTDFLIIENIENNVNFDFFMNDLLEKKNFLENELLIFLPYIAWLRKNTNINDFEKLQKLALSSIVRYNNKV